ncbi:MAG: hypothetical protein EA360_02080 [Balneolaceae bacterium]|nr:MAG: hypothetical protein EA360_02080 [Balneolaceae bacterium]
MRFARSAHDLRKKTARLKALVFFLRFTALIFCNLLHQGKSKKDKTNLRNDYHKKKRITHLT